MRKTLYEKIRESHLVTEQEGKAPVIYVDRHLVHEVTSPQAFDVLAEKGIEMRWKEKTTATADHNANTDRRNAT